MARLLKPYQAISWQGLIQSNVYTCFLPETVMFKSIPYSGRVLDTILTGDFVVQVSMSNCYEGCELRQRSIGDAITQ